MKKICFLLIMLLLTAVVVSCGSDTVEVFEVDFMIEESGIDLDGFIFNYSLNMTDDFVLGYYPESLFAELVRVRLAEVEEQFNCKMKLNYAGSSGASAVSTSIASGSFYCDAIMVTNIDVQSLTRAGGFVGLSTLSEYIDYKDTYKWGTPNMLEAMFWNDDLYGLLPASWPELLYGTVGYPILVNENLVKTMGIDDPRDYVENGVWNWDTFEAYLETATQLVNGTQVYGMTTHPPYFGHMFSFSNGVTLIEKDVNGNYICGFYTDNGRQALERAQEIFNVTKKHCFYPGWDNATITAAFQNGEGVLFPTWSSYVVGNKAMSYEIENLGLVPFPYGPKSSPDEYVSVYGGIQRSMFIPVNAPDPEASAVVLNAIYEPLPGYETEEKIKEYLVKNSFFDPRDAEIFLNMFYNTRNAFYYEGARNIPEAIIDGTNASVVQILQSNELQYNNLFEKTVIPTQIAIENLWGDLGWYN